MLVYWVRNLSLLLFTSFVLTALCVPCVFFVGTTKRKELHGTTCVRALSGTWGLKHEGCHLSSLFRLDFSCSKPEEQYSSFVLLMESRLDDDVGNIEVELYLVSKFVKSSVSSCGAVQLDAEQVQA